MSEPAIDLALVIDEDGAIQMLHDETLGVEALGPMSVQRASHVEFDEPAGEWYVEVAATGERIFQDASRAACLTFERDYFNRQLADGLTPFDPRIPVGSLTPFGPLAAAGRPTAG